MNTINDSVRNDEAPSVVAVEGVVPSVPASQEEAAVSGSCVSEVDEPSETKQGDEDEEEEDLESEYEYEDDDDDYGFIASSVTMEERKEPPEASAARIVEPWREPSKEAVDMSLRAERETTGGKRRLASDLYKIMMADTKKAGFDLKPKSEDSMDKWQIQLYGFDEDSNLQKDLTVLGLEHVELEMSFPDQYPFEPPFVRVVRPKFKRQTGFVMNGALCMELLTKDGWNPVNDIESVIVSIRSLLVVGDGRLQAAVDMPESKRQAILAGRKRLRDGGSKYGDQPAKMGKASIGHYTAAEAQAAYTHLSEYHKKKGWDNSGWWAKKG